jgi:hypothetical protein
MSKEDQNISIREVDFSKHKILKTSLSDEDLKAVYTALIADILEGYKDTNFKLFLDPFINEDKVIPEITFSPKANIRFAYRKDVWRPHILVDGNFVPVSIQDEKAGRYSREGYRVIEFGFIISLSKPKINIMRNTAKIDVSQTNDPLFGKGVTYILKKKNKKWEVTKVIGTWIS